MANDPRHFNQEAVDGIHGIVSYEFANNTDLTNFANELNSRPAPTAADLHKVGYDGANYFTLTNHAPVTWSQIDAGGTSTDPNAIHDNIASEISSISPKASPVAADYLLIEDTEDTNSKKRITIGDLPVPTVTDSDAIHDNVAGEITAIFLEKFMPAPGDHLLIEDSASGDAKRKIQIGNLPISTHALGSSSHSIDTLANFNAKISDATLDDAGDSRTPTTHAIAGSEHSTSTLAQLNAKVSDATLDDAGDPRTDTDAIHKSVASELSTLTEEVAPGGTDLILLELASGGVKRKVQVTNLPGGGGGTDDDAIHDNVANEISAISPKTALVSGDLFIIEDSEATFAKKRVDVDDIPNQVHALGSADHSSDTLANLNAKISDATLDDAGDSRTPTTHAIAGAEHSTSTLAQLNAKVSDATLDDAGDPRTDTDAIHDNVNAEINAITEKGSPVSTDLIIIEDSSGATYDKKKVQIGNLPGFGGTDTDAIHDNVNAEINAITEKGSPVSTDLLIIEDSSGATYDKKKVQIGNLPGFGGTDADAIHDNVAGEIAAIAPKGSPTVSDLLLIEDVADGPNNKKRVTIGSLPTGDDADAVHVDEANEISGVTSKGTPVNADLLIIEDSAAGNIKKSITIGSIPTQLHSSTHEPGGTDALSTAAAGTIAVADTALEGSATSFARSDHRHALPAPAAPADVTKALASAGVATTVARADHKHDVATATPSALTVGGSNSEGSSTNLARSDHNHGLPAFGTTTGTFCEGDDARLSDNRTDADAIHDNVADEIHLVSEKVTPIGADVLLIEDSASGTPWSKKRVQISNLPAGIPAAHAASHLPGGSDPLTTVAAGTIAIGDSAAEGSASSFARSDHVHAVPAPAAPADVTKAAASAGAATTFARADHKHDVLTAAGVANPPGTVNAEGASTSLARADHTHALHSYGSSASTICEGNDPRLSDNRTDPDAIHDNLSGEIDAITPKGSPVATDLLLIEDSAGATFDKKKVEIGNLSFTESQISDLDHTDPDAIHDNINAEINALAEKSSPVSTDIILIEDSSGAIYSKKRAQIGNLPGFGGSDTQAIHVDVANEISGVTSKSPVVAADLFIIEDSAASNVKKSVTQADFRITQSQITDLDHTDTDAFHDDVNGEINALGVKASPVAGDVLVIEDSDGSVFDKKKVTIGSLPVTDPTAIHTDVANEISGLANKSAAVPGDYLVIEDSQATNQKRHLLMSGVRITESQITDLTHSDPDAIHDNVASEISAVTEKTATVNGDWVLIEDSEAANVKKKVQVASIGSGLILGSEYQTTVSEAVSLTTGTTYVEKLKMTTSSLIGGDYMLMWTYELENVTNGKAVAQVEFDDTETLSTIENDNTNGGYILGTGFIIKTIAAGVHTIDIDWANGQAGRDSNIRFARIALWRML